MKTFLAFIALLILVWAFLVAKYGFHQYEYIPFLGNVQYFCSRSGSEYLYFDKGGAMVLHVQPNGEPVPCRSTGVSL